MHQHLAHDVELKLLDLLIGKAIPLAMELVVEKVQYEARAAGRRDADTVLASLDE